jgi:hypothetical protein
MLVMEDIKWFIFLIILMWPIFSFGQNEKNANDCSKQVLGQSFISDGQDHQIVVKGSKYSKLFIVFYPQFNYRISICSKNANTRIEFKLTGNNENLLFSNVNKDYIRIWDFQFSSIMNAVIELKLADNSINEENINILIGYQASKTPKPNPGKL